MTNTSLPFAIGTLTTQGIFLGMQDHLARFEKDGIPTLCMPSIAKPITQEQEDALLAKLAKPRTFFSQAELVVSGNDARQAFKSFSK